MKKQLIKMIEDLAKDTNQTEIEAISQLQSMSAKQGKESVIEILYEIKMKKAMEAGLI